MNPCINSIERKASSQYQLIIGLGSCKSVRTSARREGSSAPASSSPSKFAWTKYGKSRPSGSFIPMSLIRCCSSLAIFAKRSCCSVNDASDSEAELLVSSCGPPIELSSDAEESDKLISSQSLAE
uniref:hypothetical protein n=1 Tax=Bidens tripartita TaxID=51276 RepID=UPI001FF327EA|nr:hypothetical protein LK193_mgp21 [Bidens tripartita]UIR99018.1 hypothetical protein [Bidens tripartita]